MKWITVTCRLPEEVVELLDHHAERAAMSRYLYVGKLICRAVAPRLLPLMDSPASRRRAQRPEPRQRQEKVIRAAKTVNTCDHPAFLQRQFAYGTFCACGEQLA